MMMKKRLAFILLLAIIVTLIPIFPFSSLIAVEAADPDPSIGSPRISPSGPANSQTLTTPVEASDKANPGVLWVQKDNGDFVAEALISPERKEVGIGGTKDGKPYPKAGSTFRTVLDVTGYKPGTWQDQTGKEYSKSFVKNTELLPEKMSWILADTYSSSTSKPGVWSENREFIEFWTDTGGPKWTTNDRFGNLWNYKYSVNYATPMNLAWKGNVLQIKTMRIIDTSVTVNQSKTVTAEVETKEWAASPWTYVSDRAEGWESSNESVATISNRGQVTGHKVGTTTITAEWKSGMYHLKASGTVTVVAGTTPPDPTPSPSPSTYTITGDFDILPSQDIQWRDSFSFQAKNFIIPAACTYKNHRYLIQREGDFSLSDDVTNRTANTAYSYAIYPNIIGIGNHTVSLKIFATCEGKPIETGWLAAKDLYVSGPTNNNPPVFTAGFFKEPDIYSWDPPAEVVVNNKVNARIIYDPRPEPDTPYDPEGDPITYSWDFGSSNSEWIRSLKDEYGLWTNDEMHRWLIADVLGQHCVRVTARDSFGASSSRNVCVNVVPENPVPLIDGPYEVVEGRPLSRPFDGSRSYSPMGRSIAQYIWTNKETLYTVPGNEVITLEVVDSAGLRSLAPAAHTLVVKPDLPPIPKLNYMDIALRTTPVLFSNTSYSPDNDVIVENMVSYKYDSDNDGSYDDETLNNITMDENQQFMFHPEHVGNYRFTVYVKEDWGKEASKDFVLNVMNDNPQAEFVVAGEIEQPPGAIPEQITPAQLMSTDWKTSTFDGDLVTKRWINIGNTIQNEPNYGYPRITWKPAPFNTVYDNTTTRNMTDLEMLSEIVGEDISISYSEPAKTYSIKRNEVTQRTITKVAPYNVYNGEGWYVNFNRLNLFRSSHHTGSCTSYGNSESGGSWGDYYFTMSILGITNPAAPISEGLICNYDSKDKRSTLTGNTSTGDPVYSIIGAGNSYTLSNVVNGQTKWSVVTPGRVSANFYSQQRVLPVSSDGARIAHLSTGNVETDYMVDHYITIRNAKTGAFISNVNIGKTSVNFYSPTHNIVGYSGDTFIVLASGKLYGYDFNGNVKWTTDNPPYSISYYTSSISKDGYLIYPTSSKGNYWTSPGSADIHLNLFNISTGVVDKRILVTSWTKPSYYENGGIAFDKPHLLDNGKIGITYQTRYWDSGSDSPDAKQNHAFVIEGTVKSTSPNKEAGYSYGQFYNTSKVIKNAEIAYALKFNNTQVYKRIENAGMSFRIQDEGTMYRLESNRHKTTLVHLNGGVRTELASKDFIMNEGVPYTFKIRVVGTKIKIYANGVPIINIVDTNITEEGMYGIYSTKENVVFSDIAYTPYEMDEMNNVALVDSPVSYETSWKDPEDDPQIKDRTSWDFVHLNPNKFLDAGDGKSGLSSMHNQTYITPNLSFDRVGLFNVTYRGSDDPNAAYRYPSMTFDSYREFSGDYWQNVVVHRRPVSQFTLSIDPITHKVMWADTSYDPDRYLSSTNYSSEATGIDYRNTRGVMNRLYYYITPSGEVSDARLVTPREAGLYKVGLAVMDEYNTWSEWTEQTIQIAEPIIDEPPIPGFNLSKTTLRIDEVLSITSTAYDLEDGPAANLPHEYYIRNVTTGTTESLQSTHRGTWTKTFSSLGDMEIRQVVSDSIGQSAQLIKQVTVVNSPPIANFDWSPKPVYEGDTISLTNLSTDPDGDLLTYSWTISGPSGFTGNGTAENLTINGADTVNKPGIYTVKLTARDIHGASASVTKTVHVLLLGIQGYVRHTDAWEANRLRYNERYPNKQRLPNWFWAGEAFVLEATVTDTGVSSTKAVSVKAATISVPELMANLAEDSLPPPLWKSLLREADTSLSFKELPQGDYTFIFTVTYSNGVIRTSNVPIRIQDTVDHYMQVQRIH